MVCHRILNIVPILYSRTLLFIHSICNNLHLLILLQGNTVVNIRQRNLIGLDIQHRFNNVTLRTLSSREQRHYSFLFIFKFFQCCLGFYHTTVWIRDYLTDAHFSCLLRTTYWPSCGMRSAFVKQFKTASYCLGQVLKRMVILCIRTVAGNVRTHPLICVCFSYFRIPDTLEQWRLGSWNSTKAVPAGLAVKNPPASAGDTGATGSTPRSGGLTEEEMATYSSILAWKIPRTEELSGLQSMGSQRVGHTVLIHSNYRYITAQPVLGRRGDWAGRISPATSADVLSTQRKEEQMKDVLGKPEVPPPNPAPPPPHTHSRQERVHCLQLLMLASRIDWWYAFSLIIQNQ